MTFDRWSLLVDAYAPGYDSADRRHGGVAVPIERARVLAVFPTDGLAQPGPVRILLRRITAANSDEAAGQYIWSLLSQYRADSDTDRPGDNLVYRILAPEVRRLLDGPNLSATTRDAIGTREGLDMQFRQLQIDIEGPTALPTPRQTSRGKRVSGEVAYTPAR